MLSSLNLVIITQESFSLLLLFQICFSSSSSYPKLTTTLPNPVVIFLSLCYLTSKQELIPLGILSYLKLFLLVSVMHSLLDVPSQTPLLTQYFCLISECWYFPSSILELIPFFCIYRLSLQRLNHFHDIKSQYSLTSNLYLQPWCHPGIRLEQSTVYLYFSLGCLIGLLNLG